MASGAGVLTPKRCCSYDLDRQVAESPDDYSGTEHCFSQVPIAETKEMGKVWHTRTSTDFCARSFPSDSIGQHGGKLLLFQIFLAGVALPPEWDRKDKTGDEIRKIGSLSIARGIWLILWGRMESCGRLTIGPCRKLHFIARRPISNRPQDSILPHKISMQSPQRFGNTRPTSGVQNLDYSLIFEIVDDRLELLRWNFLRDLR
jgi:hypothetical protein